MHSEPNTKHVSVAMPVPREPSEYRATTHFGQRLRDRVPEQKRDRAVRETITDGRLVGTGNPIGDDNDRVRQYFKFIGDGWIVVVGVCDDAFLEESKKHLALTIYPADDD